MFGNNMTQCSTGQKSKQIQTLLHEMLQNYQTHGKPLENLTFQFPICCYRCNYFLPTNCFPTGTPSMDGPITVQTLASGRGLKSRLWYQHVVKTLITVCMCPKIDPVPLYLEGFSFKVNKFQVFTCVSKTILSTESHKAFRS